MIVKRFFHDASIYLREDAKRINEINVMMLGIMSVVYLGCLLVYFLVICFNLRIYLQTVTCLVAVAAQALLIVFIQRKKNHLKKSPAAVRAVCLIFGSFIMAVSLVLGVFVYADKTAILFPLMLILMCQIYTLPIVSGTVFPTVWAVIFLVFAFFYKPRDVFYGDTMAVLIALILAYAGTFAFLYYKISEFKTKKRYELLSSIDFATGLYNKTYFEGVSTEYCDTRNEEIPFLVAVYDIDNFKYFNDEFGHSFGDRVIGEVGAQAQRYFKNDPNVVLGRFGGDEFTILIKDASGIDEVKDFIKDFTDSICRKVDETLDKTITITAGACVGKLSDRYEDTFVRADLSLLKAKKEKKGGQIVV